MFIQPRCWPSTRMNFPCTAMLSLNSAVASNNTTPNFWRKNCARKLVFACTKCHTSEPWIWTADLDGFVHSPHGWLVTLDNHWAMVGGHHLWIHPHAPCCIMFPGYCALRQSSNIFQFSIRWWPSWICSTIGHGLTIIRGCATYAYPYTHGCGCVGEYVYTHR